jgi:hypothetical protein
VTDTIWSLPGLAGYCAGGMVNMGGQVWEFNPDPNRSRNGIAPLTWRLSKVEMPPPMRSSNALRTAELPDGTVVVWSGHRGATFDPKTAEWKMLGSRPDWGDGNAVYDAGRNAIWETTGSFLRMPPTGNPQNVTDSIYGVIAGAGIAIDNTGGIYIWSGHPSVVHYEPETGRWSAALSKVGPDYGAVYSKWIFLPKENVFLGYSFPRAGVWVYKPPKTGWTDIPTRSAQSYIDAAPAGSTVVIPPGLYGKGIKIDKDLSVDLTGVVFDRPVGGKANVLIQNPKRKIKVTVTGYDMPGAKVNGNGAAIRTDYDYDLTVRRFHIYDSNMGILTGNRGGTMTLEDGLIEDACCGTDLSHGVYMGLSDALVMRRVTVTNLRRLGHLVKSRASRTTIEDCKLIGGDGRYSREIDIPNGGIIVIRHNVIEKGPNTDNADSIAIGTEAVDPSKPHKALHPTSLEFTDNIVVFDRKGLPSEPAHDAGANELGKWRHIPPGTPINVSGNTFVNMRSWGEFPDFSRQNRMVPTLEAAGLRSDILRHVRASGGK